MLGDSTAVTLVVTVEDVSAEPPGWMFRAMLRRADRDVEVLGPSFVASTRALQDALAQACDQLLAVVRPE